MRGCIVKRKTRYYVVTELPRTDDGKRRQKWHSGYATRKEAERALAELVVQIDQGSYVERSQATLREFLVEDWLPTMAVQVRPSTLRVYRQMIDGYLLPRLGERRLCDLDALLLTKHYARLLEQPHSRRDGTLSPRTVRYAHVVLRHALSDAVLWRKLPYNPADAAKPPSASSSRPPEMKTWTLEQLKAFLDATTTDRDHVGWVLAATGGLRRGEICGLRWRDLDLEPRTGPPHLQVRQQLVLHDRQLVFTVPKTAASRRRVALDEHTVALLRRHHLRQRTERLAAGPGWQDNDLVVCKPDGSPVDPTNWTRHFFRTAERLGLPKIRFHDLRHTHATLALQAGIHPKIMSERLGHTSTAFTLDIYSHAVPSLQGEAAAAIGALVLGT